MSLLSSYGSINEREYLLNIVDPKDYNRYLCRICFWSSAIKGYPCSLWFWYLWRVFSHRGRITDTTVKKSSRSRSQSPRRPRYAIINICANFFLHVLELRDFCVSLSLNNGISIWVVSFFLDFQFFVVFSISK